MLAIVFDLLKKARTEGFGTEETESARNYILGQFPPTLQPAALEAAAGRLLPQDDFVLVVVGKAAEIRPLLAEIGDRQEKKISDPGFEP